MLRAWFMFWGSSRHTARTDIYFLDDDGSELRRSTLGFRLVMRAFCQIKSSCFTLDWYTHAILSLELSCTPVSFFFSASEHYWCFWWQWCWNYSVNFKWLMADSLYLAELTPDFSISLRSPPTFHVATISFDARVAFGFFQFFWVLFLTLFFGFWL